MFLIIFLFITIFWGIRQATPASDASGALILPRDGSSRMKGILALFVMEGHIVKFGNIPYLFLLDKAGVLMVGIFFFLSGYGVMYRLEHKENYLHGFLVKRFLSILVPCYLMYLLNYGIEYYKTGTIPEQFLFYVFGAEFINFLKLYWFAWVILLLYVLFYFLFHFMEKRSALVVLTIIVAVLLVTGYGIRFQRVYWGGALCFPFGIFVAQNRRKFFVEFQGKRGMALAVISITVLGAASIIYFKDGEYSFWGDLIGRNVATLAVAMLAVYFLLHLSLCNPINGALSKCYWEIYVTHVVLIQVFQANSFFAAHREMYAAGVVAVSVALAFCLNRITKIFMKRMF